MRHLIILGAGTAGTVMANRLARRYKTELRTGDVRITVVDQDPVHLYQPGLLFIPFGAYTREQVVKPRAAHVNDAVRYVHSAIARLDPGTDTVTLASGEVLSYDLCIIATGSRIAPEETEGMTGPGWQEKVFDF